MSDSIPAAQDAPSSSRKGIVSTIVRWFDSSVEYQEMPPELADKTDWVRGIPFYAMHLMCFGVIWVGWSWPAVIAAVAMYALRMFAITGFYHRYFSHRTFKTSRPFQCIMAIWGLASVQRGPLWWAAHHRHHHRHSDEEEDLHSPHRHGLYWSHMGWITSRSVFPTNLKAVPDLARFPELVFLNRFELIVPITVAAALFFLGYFAPASWGTSGAQMLIWGFFVSTVVLFHATCTINSLSHMLGRKRYPTKDESKNNPFLALLTFGEGWHNNHHYYPGAARQGFFWWEFDITYYGLKLLSWFGIIWELNAVPAAIKDPKRMVAPAGTPRPAAELPGFDAAAEIVAQIRAAAGGAKQAV